MSETGDSCLQHIVFQGHPLPRAYDRRAFEYRVEVLNAASVKTAHKLIIREPHVIMVTGKAFYDIGHAPADHSNRRSTPKGHAVSEIHRVMKMEVIP